MISFSLSPRAPKAEQCRIYRDGTLIALCSLAERDALLDALGYRMAKAPRLGWSATGKPISRRGARA